MTLVPSAPVPHAPRPLRALVFATHYRTVDNWKELFDKIKETGGDCRLAAFPWTGDPSHEEMASLDLDIFMEEKIPYLDERGITLSRLEEVARKIAAWEPDILFLADVQAYPSCAINRLLKTYTQRVTCIGLQHGFFQSWFMYNNNFCADYMLLFGERHVRALLPQYRDRCLVAGLPKLDRLKTAQSRTGDYLFYISQRFPRHDLTVSLLQDLASALKTEVRTHDHPQFGGLAGTHALSRDFIGALSDAAWVMTSYSTGGIEALYLGKEVVLLPSHGTTAWAGYPAIARDLTVAEVMAARAHIRTCKADIDLFLDDTIGGVRFDHAERAWRAVQDIMSMTA